MSRNKVNGIEGKKRAHSILAGLIPLILKIANETPVKDKKNIRAGEFVRHKTVPKEPIEIREFNLNGQGNYLRIRAYHGKASQDLFIYSPSKYFPDIVGWINCYCEARTR